MHRNPKLCIYCGKPGVTKEHFWGKWSRKHAPVEIPSNQESAKLIRNEHRIIRYLDLNLAGRKSSKTGALDRPGLVRSQTLKIACSKCNNGWMKANVDAAIPVLKRLNYGYWGKITEYERNALVKWIAQFTMSFEFADRETAMIPQEVRTQFSETGELTGHWIIAIGSAIPVTGNEPVHHRGMVLIHEDGSTEPIQVTAFMFGMLFAVAIYSAFPTPDEMLLTMSDMRLSTIHPISNKSVERPFWQHNEGTVLVVVDSVSDAFTAWADNQ